MFDLDDDSDAPPVAVASSRRRAASSLLASHTEACVLCWLKIPARPGKMSMCIQEPHGYNLPLFAALLAICSCTCASTSSSSPLAGPQFEFGPTRVSVVL